MIGVPRLLGMLLYIIQSASLLWVSLCVPYGFSGHPKDLEYAINRELYPTDEYPAGQWDYQLFYYENFRGGAKRNGAGSRANSEIIVSQG